MSSTITPAVVPVLRTLADALDAIDRAGAASRLQAAVEAIRDLGFEHVVIALRDETFTATQVAQVHGPGVPPAFLQAMPGVVWRRRLAMLERHRVGELFLLDGSDPWVAREFFGSDPSPRHPDPERWLPNDLVVAVLRDPVGGLLGTVTIAGPRGGRRPGDAQQREVALVLRHLAARLSLDRLGALADRRAQRLQRLQEAGAALARSLDEQEIVRELARQAVRVSGAEGVVVAVPDLEHGLLTTTLRVVRGTERPRATVRLGDGIVAEVARTGRPVRFGDREADRDRSRERLASLSLYDVLGEAAPAASVVAVPMRAGTRLFGVLAVHAPVRDVFSAEDEEVLATMASQAATAIANARRYAESERERRQTEALADVARAVGGSLRLGEVHRLILRHALSLLDAQGACIALRFDDYMHIVAAAGAADVLAGVHLPVATSLLGRAVRTGDIVVSNDFRHDPDSSRAVQRLATFSRAAIAPMRTASGTIGALAVLDRDEPFRDEDARVLQRLADQVAVAIVNARLFEEIEKATREWKVAFDATASGIVVLDEERRIRRCNARAAELCGRASIHELLGLPFRAALGGADAGDGRPGVDALVGALCAADPLTREAVPLGGGRVFEFSAAPHPDGGCVVTFDDVTAQREGAAALARIEARYTRLVESAKDAIFTLDAEGCFTSVNRAFEAETGRSRDTLLGAHYSTVLDPRDADAAAQALARVVAGGSETLRLRYRGADGQPRLGALTTAPLAEAGAVTGLIGIMHDVTDEELHRALDVQEARASAVGQYLAAIANELNNPLAGVLATAEVEAESPTLGDEGRRAMREIRDGARRAARIVSHLLTISSGHAAEPQRLPIDDLVRATVDLHGHRLRARGIGIATDIADGLPPVRGDSLRLQQVLLALLANAEEALADWQGPRTVEVRVGADGDVVRVEVRDTGPGISEAHRRWLFTPMFTTHREAPREGGRRGLGLAVAAQVVEAHGGRIEAVTPPEGGACFVVTLPAVRDAAGGEARATGAILLVDDEPALADAVARFLARQGHAVEVAPGGNAALDRLLTGPEPDLVLLDLRLHDLSGEAVYERLAVDRPAVAARVAFMSGDLHAESVGALLARTGRPAIGKPFELAHLQQRIEQWLAARPTA
jgi:PAS domain S-box-containing protein